MAESTKPAKAALPKSVFEVDVPNHELLKLAYDASTELIGQAITYYEPELYVVQSQAYGPEARGGKSKLLRSESVV